MSGTVCFLDGDHQRLGDAHPCRVVWTAANGEWRITVQDLDDLPTADGEAYALRFESEDGGRAVVLPLPDAPVAMSAGAAYHLRTPQ
jgi:hypothetical protein